MIGGFPPPSGSKEERNLLSVFKSLNTEDKQTLLKFAEFLASGANNKDSDSEYQKPKSELPTPQSIERPAKESVIKAIKRLNKTYPMTDKSTVLDRTSSLMTEHLMKGREAVSVIDELEIVFKEAFEKSISN